MKQLYFMLLFACGLCLNLNAQTTIAAQDFDGLSGNTFCTDMLTSASFLTNTAASNSGGGGLDFSTVWFQSRSNATGPVFNESSDFIGVNDFAGNNAPDVGPDGTSVSTNKNFQFNDGDGLLSLRFEDIDMSGFSNRTLSFDYWINDTGYENDDNFIVDITDGTNTVQLLGYGESLLEANSSADDGTANWMSFSMNIDADLAGLDDTQIQIQIGVDNNSGSENIFVDNIEVTGTLNGGGPTACSELFISEYIEGSSNNKCLELYNPTNASIDLSSGNYALVRYSNGNTSGTTIGLSGTVAAEGVFVICNSSADPTLLSASDQTSGSISHNGDDAYELQKDGTVIDRFGRVGEDPGSQWSNNGVSTQNETLVRKASVTFGDPNSTAPFDPSEEYDAFGQDNFSFIGEHSSDCGGTAPTGPQAGDIVITEIMQNPSAVSDSNGEYFEVYNTTGSDIDLNGWTISDNGSDSHTIGSSVIVPAGGFAVLGRNTDMSSNGGAPVDYSYGSSWFLSNGADEVVITAPDGTEIDRVEYDGGSSFPDPSGASMNLNPMALDFVSNDDGSNWCTSTSSFGNGDLGTPGAPNDMCNNNCVISGATLTEDGDCSGDNATFRVDFNVANGSGNYSLVDANDGTVYGSFNPGNPDGNYFLIGTVNGPTTAGTIDVIVSDGEGCTSDPITVNIPDCPPMATCVNPGELVITEIMQNPNTIFDSNGEYFEIYNASGTTVDLMNFVIRDNDFDAHTISSSVVIPAGGYVVLARNADDSQNGGLGAAYEYDNFALGNGSDEVIIECNGTIIDAVFYDGGGAFPDPNGASMNLDPNTLDATSNDNGDSWCESTTSYDPNNLGTPGAPNDGCSGLPFPYEFASVGCNGFGEATYNSMAEAFELSTTCAKNSFNMDRGTYVTAPACGDFIFDAKLESVFPSNAYAGITVRESLSPGAKKFSIIQYPGNGRKNAEYRMVTNANYQVFWNATWTVGWQYLRIQRMGNYFIGYASFTGAPGSYSIVFSAFIQMNPCVEAGMMVAAELEGQFSSAVFSNVSLSTTALQVSDNTENPASTQQAAHLGIANVQAPSNNTLGQFNVFPNPVTSELNVSFEDAMAEEATIRILSMDGRSIYENVHGIQGATVNIPLSQLNMTEGMYLLQVATGEEVRTERFIKASR